MRKTLYSMLSYTARTRCSAHDVRARASRMNELNSTDTAVSWWIHVPIRHITSMTTIHGAVSAFKKHAWSVQRLHTVRTLAQHNVAWFFLIYTNKYKHTHEVCASVHEDGCIYADTMLYTRSNRLTHLEWNRLQQCNVLLIDTTPTM